MEYFIFLIILAMLVLPPVAFVICLVKSIIHTRKYKKGEEGKTRAAAFGIVSGALFAYLIVETLLIIWFAEGIAHM